MQIFNRSFALLDPLAPSNGDSTLYTTRQDFIRCGDETGVQGRFKRNVVQVMTAVSTRPRYHFRRFQEFDGIVQEDPLMLLAQKVLDGAQ